MKILFLANRVPYPPFRGDKLKIYNLAKRLCSSHELHLLTFAQSEEDWQHEEPLKEIFQSVTFIGLPKWRSAVNCLQGVFGSKPFQVHYFRSSAMHQAVRRVLEEHQFDAVHVQHLRMAQYLHRQQQLPRILDLPDAFSLYWQRKLENTRNALFRYFERIEQKRVYQYERQMLKRYNRVLVCSREDKAYLEREHSLNHLGLLPNGVDTSVFYPRAHDYSHNHTLLFTGNMDYGPNVDAVQYFAEQIFPLVQQQFPAVRFVIAGQRPVPKVTALANEAVKVTGFIPDLSVQYNEASVVVAPLRFGAGTQNKVLEAMAMGIPVVCSHIGFEGLGIANGEGAIMETDAETFAQSIIRLLADETLRRAVGTKGTQVIASSFSWDKIAKLLDNYFNTLTGK